MAQLPQLSIPDPTLEAADRELENRARREPRRGYLGMSAIGHACSRKLWYDLKDPLQEAFSAATLKRFEDGHRSEALLAARLRMVPGIELWTVDPTTGKQVRYEDFGGVFAGHCDGVIRGLIQAPKSYHIWEAKCTNDKRFAEFGRIKGKFGEKGTLEQWDHTYFCQAQAYMGYEGLDRHYLTVCTPGGRTWDSCRTEFSPGAFEEIKAKAKRIIESPFPLAKVSENPTWWQCKFCHYSTRCHGNAS